MAPNVKTEVTPGRNYQVLITGSYDMPVVHKPIVVPAPEPCKHKDEVPRTFKGDVTYWWKLANTGSEGRQMAFNGIKGDLRYRWFRFRLVHGITRNDRSWLFKR
jgi:hypothetical protein